MQDSQLFLLRHGDKLIAGSFAAWLAYALAMPLFFRPAALGEGEHLAQALATIETHEQNFEVSVEPAPGLLPLVRHELDSSEVPSVEPFGDWLTHRRPSFIYEVLKPLPPPEPVHAPPGNVRITNVEHHKVSVSWKPDPLNHYVKLTGCDVLRQDRPGAPFLKIGSVDSDRTEFADENAPARASLTYRIDEKAVLDTDDGSLPKNMPPLAPGLTLVSALSPVATTPRDFYVAIESGAAADPLAAAGTVEAEDHATLRVYAWSSGKFPFKVYRNITAGKSVGALEAAFPLDRAHTARVDFGCGAVLKDVRLEKRKLPGSNNLVTKAVATIVWPGGESEEIVAGEYPDLK